jgi:hypothetical protein
MSTHLKSPTGSTNKSTAANNCTADRYQPSISHNEEISPANFQERKGEPELLFGIRPKYNGEAANAGTNTRRMVKNTMLVRMQQTKKTKHGKPLKVERKANRERRVAFASSTSPGLTN